MIGTGGKDIAEEDAWNHVVGLDGRPGHLGPARPVRRQTAALRPRQVVRHVRPDRARAGVADEVADRDDLRIVTKVNGEVRQDATTADLIFDVPTLIQYLSRITTLVTGDVIFTGTPEGVGATQGKFLRDGDVITTTIDGIGTITNRCVRVSDYQLGGG